MPMEDNQTVLQAPEHPSNRIEEYLAKILEKLTSDDEDIPENRNES